MASFGYLVSTIAWEPSPDTALEGLLGGVDTNLLPIGPLMWIEHNVVSKITIIWTNSCPIGHYLGQHGWLHYRTKRTKPAQMCPAQTKSDLSVVAS